MIELLHGDMVRVIAGEAQGQRGTIKARWGWHGDVPRYLVQLSDGVRALRQDFLERVTP